MPITLEHPPGTLENHVFLFDFMVSRSGWHRDRGVFICSQSIAHYGHMALAKNTSILQEAMLLFVEPV